jgi:hypothetical protein
MEKVLRPLRGKTEGKDDGAPQPGKPDSTPDLSGGRADEQSRDRDPGSQIVAQGQVVTLTIPLRISISLGLAAGATTPAAQAKNGAAGS